MSRRLKSALLSSVFLLTAPAAASAQTAPDERANARALAGIAARVGGEIEATLGDVALPGPDRAYDDCSVKGNLRRAKRRLRERHRSELVSYSTVQMIARNARAVAPIFDRVVADMHAVPTADPALRGGRTAWRRIARVYGSFAAVPLVDVCDQLRGYLRRGLRPTPTMRHALQVLTRAEHTGGINRRLRRAIARLKQLGVPSRQADLFGGPLED